MRGEAFASEALAEGRTTVPDRSRAMLLRRCNHLAWRSLARPVQDAQGRRLQPGISMFDPSADHGQAHPKRFPARPSTGKGLDQARCPPVEAALNAPPSANPHRRGEPAPLADRKQPFGRGRPGGCPVWTMPWLLRRECCRARVLGFRPKSSASRR